MRQFVIFAALAAGVAVACSSSDDAGASSSSSSSSTSSSGADASSSGAASSGSASSSSSGSTSGAPVTSAGSIEVTRGGKPVELKGTTTAMLSNNTTLLTFFRTSYADGTFDPQNPVPVTTIELVFEDTLKPFVLPTAANSQTRRATLDVNGVKYYSSIANAKTKSDTFAYADGRIKGVWTFDAPAGAPNQPLEEIVITVDVEVPAAAR